jgi:hypothetical protein
VTPDCHIVALVERTWADVSRDGLYVLPTTTSTLSGCDRWVAADPALTVIGRIGPHANPPLQWLAETAADASAVVFSDQLVNDEDAPLLISHGGARCYMSVVETIASTRHRRAIHAWTGDRLDGAPPGSETREVLRLLLRYTEACANLGPSWRMRDAQLLRSPEARIRTAARRLRLFKSAVLHAFREEGLSPQFRETIQAARAAHRSLPT